MRPLIFFFALSRPSLTRSFSRQLQLAIARRLCKRLQRSLCRFCHRRLLVRRNRARWPGRLRDAQPAQDDAECRSVVFSSLSAAAGDEKAADSPSSRFRLAVKNTFWRITLIYITSLTIIGLLIPYNYSRLLGAPDAGSGSAASPFVLVFSRANIRGLDHLVNVTICISVLSIGLSCVYAGSRTLTALAETGYAPKIFAYIDRAGRPLFSTIAILAFAPIAYVNCAPNPDVGGQVFDWLLALSGLSTLFTWLAICLSHIRFRKAWRVQGHSLEELPFTAYVVKSSQAFLRPRTRLTLCPSPFTALSASGAPGSARSSSSSSSSPSSTLRSGPSAACRAIRPRSPPASSSRTSPPRS